MRYAILILLVACTDTARVETPEEGGFSNVDDMGDSRMGSASVESLRTLGGMAGMEGGDPGDGMGTEAGRGGAGGAGGVEGTEGADPGTDGDGGSEAPEPPVGGQYGDACSAHDDCMAHPDDSLAGYCHAGECLDTRSYNWVQPGGRCGGTKNLCVDEWICSAEDRCVYP